MVSLWKLELLDFASASSLNYWVFSTYLRLPRQHHSMKVSGIGGSATWLSSHGMVHLDISSQWGRTLVVAAIVLLQADVFSRMMLHGQQFGPLGSPPSVFVVFCIVCCSRYYSFGRQYVWATSSLGRLPACPSGERGEGVEVHFWLGLPVVQIMAGHKIIKNQSPTCKDSCPNWSLRVLD